MTEQMSLLPDESNIYNTFSSICKILNVPSSPGWPDLFGQALRFCTSTRKDFPIRTLSLFSGAGGLDIGFRDAGFEIIGGVEIEEKFVKTLKENSEPNVAIHCMDIRKFDPATLGRIDFVIGGPPCQTFSAAGRRMAGVLGTSDERGTLFEEYVRILKLLNPQGFLFENVSGILSADNGNAWEEIKSSFEEAGYQIFYRSLDAADYGVPQFRERIFIVGTKDKEFLFPRPTHGPDSPEQNQHYTAINAISGSVITDEDRNRVVDGRYGHLLNDIPPGLNYSFYTENLGHPRPVFAWRSKFSDFLYKADPEMPVRTLKARGGKYTGPFHWDNRPFSVTELKRLQTIPDTYSLVGSRATVIQQIGNSVPPQLSRILAVSILEQLFGVQLPFCLPKLQKHEILGFKKRKRVLNTIYLEKAKAHIQTQSFIQPEFTNREYLASLSSKFNWEEVTENDGEYHVSIFVSRNLEMHIYVSKNPTPRQFDFEIIIEPNSEKKWILHVERIILHGERLEESNFVSVWKALEHELMRNEIKADLVQLCGYYQYVPNFNSKISYECKTSKEWQVVELVVAGKGIAQILSTEELSQIWNINSSDITHIAKFLKQLGYEVRNSKTNPQIPENHYLVPYAFPTLSPMSMQLKKSLI